jgi:hypothetical protein
MHDFCKTMRLYFSLLRESFFFFFFRAFMVHSLLELF